MSREWALGLQVSFLYECCVVLGKIIFPLSLSAPRPEATITRENEWLLPTPTRYAIFKFVFLGLERDCARGARRAARACDGSIFLKA